MYTIHVMMVDGFVGYVRTTRQFLTLLIDIFLQPTYNDLKRNNVMNQGLRARAAG